ncbi:MAG TPA: diguanylate cyclase [Rhodanobacteraceae bacterium]|nr:diguanylate cyclase [Rhodanobacteraceae bacterium]
MRSAIILGLLLTTVLVAVCATTLAHADAVPLIVERLEVADGEVTAERVIAGALDSEFKAQDYAALIPARDRDVWYRIRLTADWNESRPPALAVFDPVGLRADFYVPPGYTAQPRSIYSDEIDPGYTRHAIVLVLPVRISADRAIYIHVDPERAIPRRVEVRDVSEYRAGDLARARLDVLFPAFQLATLLVMFAFFLALREQMYAYFVAYVLVLVIYELFAFGIAYDSAIVRVLAPLAQRPSWCAALVAVALNIAFSRLFLELPRFAPRLDRVLGASVWVFAGLAACTMLPVISRGWWIEDALSVLLLLTVPLLITAAMLVWLHGGRRGGLFLGAWIPALLLVILRVLQLRMQWPLPLWLEFGLPAALAYANLVLAFVLAGQTLSFRYERDVAHRLAERDPLTGVLNRRAILARLRAEFAKARQSGEPLSVLFLDLDHFKNVNDSYGHRAGDQCLRGVIGPIAGELRQGDALGRYGGEEFLILLPGAGPADAEVVAERIRRRVQDMPMLISGMRIGLTVSLGVAAVDLDVANPDDLIERADAALYRSKSSGRNLVSTHVGTPPNAPVGA